MLPKIWQWFMKTFYKIEPPDSDEVLSPYENETRDESKSEIPPELVAATPDEMDAMKKAREKRERRKKRNLSVFKRANDDRKVTGAYGKCHNSDI